MFPQATRVLMEREPPGLDLNEVVGTVEEVEGVMAMHHLHVWELDEQHRALEAHIVLSSGVEVEKIKSEIRPALEQHFSIGHATLEFEFERGDDANVLH